MHLPRIFWILLAAGALLRVAAIELRPAGVAFLGPDEGDYVEIARNVAAGQGFAFEGEPTAYRDPLFPYLAARLMEIAGEKAVLYVQLLLDLGTAFLLFLLIRRRLSERAAVLGAGMWLLYPAAILFTALFLTETLFVFLWVLAMWVFDRVEAESFGAHTVRHFALGIVLGLVLLTRSTGVILAASVVLMLIYRRRFRIALLVLAMTFLTVLPWMLRNASIFGAFTLNTNSGVNLYIGNNPQATGAYRFDSEVTEPLSECHGEVQFNRCATELALDYWRSHPVDALVLWPRKFAYLWSTDMSLWAHYLPRPERPLREQLHAAPLVLLVLTGLIYMLLTVSGIAGVVLGQALPWRGLLLTQLLLATVAALATYGLARYHFPLMPALVFGAVSWSGQPRAWQTASSVRRTAAIGITALLVIVWLAEIWTIVTA